MDNEKTEAQIQAEILEAVGSIHGVQVMRVNSGLFMDSNGVRRVRSVEKGTHDILMCVAVTIMRRELINAGFMANHHPRYYTFGQMVWMEVKRPGKKLSEEQERSAAAWEKAGAICVKVTSAIDAKQFLEDLPLIIEAQNARPNIGLHID